MLSFVRRIILAALYCQLSSESLLAWDYRDKISIGDFPLYSKSGFSIPDLEIYFLLEIINAKRDSLN
jgi:hypothetical protein